ncbi:MAG: hypothetical protein IT371_11415 [Deltaproteobacteria bacterium]|nr:hypothetical protein [Deltaproteobacteria bacterium]
MRTRFGWILPGVLAAASMVGCGSSSTTTADSGTTTQNDSGGMGDMGHTGDMGGPAPDSGSTTGGLFQGVASKVTLPTSDTEYAQDVDGKGKKNKLGGVLAAMKQLELQIGMNEALRTGQLLVLTEVFAKALTDDPAASIQVHLGKDLDGNATDNFSGTEEFGVHAKSPPAAKVNIKITGGKIEGSGGELVFPLPMGADLVLLTLKKAVIRGTVSTTGISDGILAGAIPVSEFDSKLAPAMAGLINAYLKDTKVDAATKTMLKTMFDGNGDGNVTTDEVKSAAVMSLIKNPDVDLNGDGKLDKDDGISGAISFTAVAAKIKR